jgi:hypothetical protein
MKNLAKYTNSKLARLLTQLLPVLHVPDSTVLPNSPKSTKFI